MCINRAPEEEKGKNKRIITENFQSKLNYIDLYIQRIQHNLNGTDTKLPYVDAHLLLWE